MPSPEAAGPLSFRCVLMRASAACLRVTTYLKNGMDDQMNR